jgi:uncharacterized protein (TIGR02466 family)
MNTEKHVALAYATPIGRFRISDCAAMNDELRSLILEKERSCPSDNYANVGGWHSTGDLLDWPSAAIASLKNAILEAVSHVIQVTSDHQSPRGAVRVVAWANVARRGDYHRIHNHPSSAWSGVYYVATGGTAPEHPLSGVLELCDPRPFSEMVPTPGAIFGQRMIVRPEAGTMVVFPSWLYHFVNPFVGEGERISVAFNVQWRSS